MHLPLSVGGCAFAVVVLVTVVNSICGSIHKNRGMRYEIEEDGGEERCVVSKQVARGKGVVVVVFRVCGYRAVWVLF